MRPEVLLRFFGRFHLLVALLLLVPLGVGLLHDESILWPYLGPSVGLTLVGAYLSWEASRRNAARAEGIRRREGFLLVSLSWILIVLYGSLPYLISGEIRSISSAIFESTSGFTTTGATILEDIESLPRGLLFWRSFTHWLGGMGIIVLSVAILPELAVGGMQLFSAESTGIAVEKLAPRIAETAKRLWLLYGILTALEVMLLMGGGMDLFDASTHAFATTATGGFSPKNASIGHYQSTYIELVIVVFMFLAGTNFALQYRVFVGGQAREALRSSEIRLFAGITVLFTALVTWDLISSRTFEPGDGFRQAGFHVVSILTTTGFTSHEAGGVDFDRWPTFSKFLLVILMTIGGCAGSTAGGLKVIRLVVICKHAAREFQRLLYPRMVKTVKVNGKAISEETLWGILGFFLLYVMAFLASTVALTIFDPALDLVTAVTASLSALNSIGPGLGLVGPAENFAFLHPTSKLVLSFCMVLGRLEIYTFLIIFLPKFWRGR